MAIPAAVPIIAGGVKLLGSLFGGSKASQAMKNYRNNINNQLTENQNWYDRRYNEDFTQRADAQRMLTMTEDAIRKRNKAAAGTQAVMGGNEASVAAAKEANNQATSDVAARIVAAGEQRKDQIESQYKQTKQNLQNQLNNLEYQKAMNTAQAIQGVGNAAGDIIGAFGGSSDYGNDIWSRGGYKKYVPGEMPWADASMSSKDLKDDMARIRNNAFKL